MTMPQLLITFVLMIISTSNSQNVTTSPGEKGCTIIRRPPLTPGWTMECNGYTVDYLIDKEVTVTCTKFFPPYKPAMFVPYNISEIRLFHFVECPPPNASFAEALSGMKAVWLVYEVNEHTIDLDSRLFDGLPDLEVIVLNVTMNGAEMPVDIFWRLDRLVSLSMATELDSVPENLFANLTSLQSLSILKNAFTTLPKDVFSPLGNLKSLVLEDNGALQELPAEIFYPLTQLQELSLRNNKLSAVLPSDINRLSNLTSFFISGNELKQLDPDLFQGNLNLQTIDLGHNPTLPTLPYNLLQNLTHLKNVTIRDCNLTDIPDTIFSYASNLERIFMQNNRMKNISSVIFSGNTRLKEIDLLYNDVVNISVDAFATLFQLEALCLSKNNVVHLPQGLFDKTINLASFDISATCLADLPADLFQYSENLKYLNLKNNLLRSLTGQMPFGPSKIIEVLDLSYNNLAELIVSWDVYDRVKEINLQYNIMNNYSLPIFKGDATVLLEHSFIQRVSVDDLKLFDDTTPASGKTVTVTFQMINNSFICDCQMFKFAQFINDSIYLTQLKFHTIHFYLAEQYVCSGPPKLLNKLLLSLDKREFVCAVSDPSCPESCECFTRGFDDVTLVNCSNRSLTSLPTTLPFNTTELYFSQNQLTSLNSSWMNITLLDVSDNEIESANWTLPSTITELRLQGNRMTWVPLSVQTLIQTNNARVYLGNNPFPCNCSMRDLRILLSLKTSNFPDINNISCTTGDKQSVKPILIDMSEQALCPSAGSSGTLIFVLALLVTLAVVLPVVLVAYYKNKRVVVAFLYTRFNGIYSVLFDEEELDENKIYDAFISYSSLNEDIAQALLEELENKDVFRLCIHGRDWLPGNLIVDNISMSVQSSRRTILVISKDFLESIWFQVEFHTAYYQMLEDKMDRLIIIIQGDLPEKSSLDEDLQVLLTTKTYLIWGEKWFWDKLRYAMPHKKKRRKVLSEKDKPMVSIPF